MGKGSGGRYWTSGSSEACRYPHRRKMSKIVSRSCCSTAGVGAVSAPAFVAIASSLQIDSYSRKGYFRVHYYARPFRGMAHVSPGRACSEGITIKLHPGARVGILL